MAVLPNSLDILSVGMIWKDWPLKNLEDKNHFFLTGQPFTISFAIVYTGTVMLGRIVSVFCLYRSYTLRAMYRHSCDECFPSGLSWGGIPEGYSDRTPGGVRGKQGFNGEELDVSLGCHQVYPGASPPRLGGRTGRDKCGACLGKGQTEPDQGGKLRCKVCLHPHLEQGGTPLVERWRWSLFFSLTDGN